jgi:hypothetical protein
VQINFTKIKSIFPIKALEKMWDYAKFNAETEKYETKTQDIFHYIIGFMLKEYKGTYERQFPEGITLQDVASTMSKLKQIAINNKREEEQIEKAKEKAKEELRKQIFDKTDEIIDEEEAMEDREEALSQTAISRKKKKEFREKFPYDNITNAELLIMIRKYEELRSSNKDIDEETLRTLCLYELQIIRAYASKDPELVSKALKAKQSAMNDAVLTARAKSQYSDEKPTDEPLMSEIVQLINEEYGHIEPWHRRIDRPERRDAVELTLLLIRKSLADILGKSVPNVDIKIEQYKTDNYDNFGNGNELDRVLKDRTEYLFHNGVEMEE